VAKDNERERGIVLAQLKDMLSQEACRKWLISKLHKKDPTCPACRQLLPVDSLQRFNNLHRLQCTVCGKRFTAFTNTILEGAKISSDIFFVLLVSFTFKLKTKEVTLATGLSRQAVAIWRSKISKWQSMSGC